MVTIINTHYPGITLKRKKIRAEVVSVAYGSCDLCGARCEESRQYDGYTDWSQATAVLIAKAAGWLERMSGRVSQLVCPQCTEKERQTCS